MASGVERIHRRGAVYEIIEVTPRDREFIYRRDGIDLTSRVRVDLFKESGKWKYGFWAYVDPQEFYNDDAMLLRDLDATQKEVVRGSIYEYRVVVTQPDYDRAPPGIRYVARIIDGWKHFKPVPGDE